MPFAETDDEAADHYAVLLGAAKGAMDARLEIAKINNDQQVWLPYMATPVDAHISELRRLSPNTSALKAFSTLITLNELNEIPGVSVVSSYYIIKTAAENDLARLKTKPKRKTLDGVSTADLQQLIQDLNRSLIQNAVSAAA